MLKARYLGILLLYAVPYVYFSAVLDAYAYGWGRLGRLKTLWKLHGAGLRGLY